MSRYQKSAIATLGAAYLLLVAGAIVRMTGAGRGCGSQWPFCNGQFIPSSTGSSTVYDFTHRLLALLVSVLVVTLIVEAWGSRRNNPLLFLGSVAAGGLVVAQVVLGAISAVTTLSIGMDIAHLALAQIFLAVLLLIVLIALAPKIVELSGRQLGRVSTGLGWTSLVAAVSAFVLILTGGYIATSNVPAACNQWPLCDGRIVPTGFSATDIHIIHRWVAFITAVAVL